MAISDLFGPSSQSKNKEFHGVPRAYNKLADPSNPGPSLVPFQVAKYTKDDLQQILKTVLELRIPAYSKNWRTLEDLSERTVKPRALDVYKNKSHIDCYNFIHQCKDYFVTSKSRGRNRVPFVATFLKEKTLNRWQ